MVTACRLWCHTIALNQEKWHKLKKAYSYGATLAGRCRDGKCTQNALLMVLLEKKILKRLSRWKNQRKLNEKRLE